jgi:DNA-directed RNA polymerase subunit RPC12/RpoP
LYFAHEASNVIQCTCGSVIFRKDNQLQAKPYAIIQQPNDPIQPGTEGIYKGRTFKVLGRFRAWIEEFVFNYWTIVFQDNKTAYLAEGYGLYAIYEPAALERRLTSKSLEGLKVGSQRDFFLLERKYTCYKWEIEGELIIPYDAATFKTYEFAAMGGQHMEVMDFSNNEVFTFNVTYTSFEALSLRNTRAYTPVVKVETCIKCGKQNEIKAFPYTQSFACIHCEARYSLRDGYSFKQERTRNDVSDGTSITLGSKGKVKGVEYEVIGYVLKQEDNAYQSQWKEYTLFNPQEGFAFLSEYNGHWIYVREQADAPVLERDHLKTFTYDHEPFQLYNAYNFDIINSVGEFPYNIFNDGDRKVKEFISPPEVWIREQSSREGILWYHGEHINGKELERAFGDGIILPAKVGVGAVEPKGFVNPFKIAVVAFVGILLLVFSHLITTYSAQKRMLLNRTYSIADSLSTATFVTDRFTLDKWRSNLQFEVMAPVDNSWFELTATLVNTQTGTEYTLQQGVEYYHGYSEGEYWTEGDRSETAYLSKIPGGTYYLQLQGTQEKRFSEYSSGGLHQFSVAVTYDVPNDRNLAYCIITLIVWAFIHYQVIQYQEKSRWSNSPFSPFNEK